MLINFFHYYVTPYGRTLTHSTNQGVQKYKYNGKEFDRTHGLDWYDYCARQLDPTTGLFTSMDPLCEKYYNISPYSYCAGNPISSEMSPLGAAETFSHEAYGHGLLYLQNGHNHLGASHQVYEGKETNLLLKQMIMNSRKETIRNNR